jgi:dephospho-CoA kinase
LAAKDVLDVQIVVESIAVAESIAERLRPAGLVMRRGLRWDRVAGVDGSPKLFARNADPGRAANVHLRPVISPWWRDALLIREWLRAHPEEAASYEAHKRAVAATGADTDAYAEAKTPWLVPALQRAGRWAGSHTLEIPGS